ncbi:histidine kinase [Cellulomonas sp. P5_E12]
MAVVVDQSVRPAPRPGQPGRGAAVRLVLRHRWASLVAALACGASVAAVALMTIGDVWHLPPAPQLVVDATVGFVYPVTALVILLGRAPARGTRALAWVMLGAGLASALAVLTAALALVASEPSDLVGILVQLQSWLWVPGFLPLVTWVPLLYPDGLLPGRIWRVVASAAGAGIVLLALAVGLYPEDFQGAVPIAKPVTNEGVAKVLAVAAAVLLVPATIASVWSLVLRLRRSQGLRRRQVVVLLVAAGTLVAATLAQGLLPSPVDVLVQAAAVALVPIAIGVAVTRHRLYDLDTAVCRALVTASLAICLIGVYLSVFAVLQAVGDERSALSAAVAAGVTGALIHPLGRRLWAGADRLFYGDRADPYAVTSRLSSRLAAPGLDIAAVPDVMCQSVVSSLRLGAAEVWLLVDGEERRLARAGDSSTSGERFAMRHRGETAGWLVVAPRPGEVVVTERDADILAGIADLVAPSIAALRLHQELQRSRELLVAAREAERQRLRRELHDGVGATLAGLRLQVESAQALVADPTASALLKAAGGSVGHAVAEVRTISNGLRPPGIDDLGLARALVLLAERHRTTGLAVEVAIDEVGEVGAATEVATYRIAAEALANVSGHAHANRIVLTLTRSADALALVVVDDGVGPDGGRDPRPGSGLGIASMRQRAEEIGGSLTVRAVDPGPGTELRAVLPSTLEGPR